MLQPSRSFSRMSCTEMRVPAMTGLPPRISGSVVMREEASSVMPGSKHSGSVNPSYYITRYHPISPDLWPLFRADEGDVLRALPEDRATHLTELLAPLDDCEEVVAGELADLAGEASAAVGKKDLGFAEAAGVEEDLAGGGMAGVVLIAHVQVELAEGDPAGLAAPARMDDLLLIRQQCGEGGAGRGRVVLLHARGVGVGADGDGECRHVQGSLSIDWALSAARTRSGVMGCWLSQIPVASWIAIATAGAKGTSAISATPRAPYGPSGSASSRITGVIAVGMSSTVGRRYV